MLRGKFIICENRRATRSLYKREQIKEGGATGFRSVPDGEEECFYEATVDLDSLDVLAKKAASNKSGKARDGALTVRVISRRRI
jgi:hypothetical protein